MNTLRSAASVLAFAFLLGLGGQLYAEEKGDAELARDLTVQGIAAQHRGDHAAALAYFDFLSVNWTTQRFGIFERSRSMRWLAIRMLSRCFGALTMTRITPNTPVKRRLTSGPRGRTRVGAPLGEAMRFKGLLSSRR